MSKSGELKTIECGFSIDKRIDIQHRSGDIESGGNRLDLYAQAESAEEVFFESEDEKARRVFLKLFKKFLKITYTKAERRFLIMSASGAKPQELRQQLGIRDILKYREAVQKKGFENAEALRAAIVYSGWSKAEEFAETLFKRVELFRRGENVIETLPENEKFRQRMQAVMRYRITHREEILQTQRKWREEHREERREYNKQYFERNKEKIREHKKRYHEEHREERREYRKHYYEEHREERQEYRKRYYEEHSQETLQKQREYKKRHREEIREQRKQHYKENREILLEKVKIYKATLSEERKADLREYMKAYAERNREKRNAQRRACYQRKKMERLAAKLRAQEGLPELREEMAETPQEIIID